MKESDKILLTVLLKKIRTELINTLTCSQTPEPNTHAYNTLTKNIQEWQNLLEKLSKRTNSQEDRQHWYRKNIYRLHPADRWAANQSIKDKLKNIQSIKKLIKKVQESIERLSLNAFNPTKAEILLKAFEHMAELKLEQQELQRELNELNNIARANNDTETVALIREIRALNYQQNPRPTPSTSLSPEGILLAILILFTLLKNALSSDNHE